MKRVALFTPNPSDSTSFYRSFGPFSRLHEITDFRPAFPREVSWASYAFADVAYMHRPSTKEHVKMIKYAKAMKKKVWVDNDDDLLNIPIDNSCHEDFQKPEVRQAYIESMMYADVVTVQCEELKTRYQTFNKNIHVVPNAWDEKTFGHLRREPAENKIVLWRGSETHMKDVYTYAEEIVECMKQHLDWKIVFLGMAPFFILDKLSKEQTRVIHQMGILEYFELLSKINPAIMIVPLNDNSFNRIKSNIAWIEGTVAGAAVLRPDWDNWAGIDNYCYNGRASFVHRLNYMMSNPDKLRASNLGSFDYVMNCCTLGTVNKIRKEILESL